MFYFWVKPILTKSNILVIHFFQKKIRKAGGRNKECQISSKNIFILIEQHYLYKSHFIGKFTTFRTEQFPMLSFTKIWETNSVPRELEGFAVCVVFKGGYICSPTGTEGTSQTRIKMHSKRCQEESFSRANLFKGLLLPVLSANCSFNKSWIYTQTFVKQINK